jgi:RNA polymerase sigma factor (sigma-70 family)
MDQQASEQTQAIESWVQRLKEGDAEAREQLLQLASDRLLHLTRRIKKDFARIARWEETDDIFQQAVLRLYTAMESVELQSATHFLRLAAQQIRRQLIDLSRSYYGPQGAARHHASQAGFGDDNESPGRHAFEAAEVSQDPQKMQEWSEFHQLIEDLNDDERAVVDLLWYHGMSQEDAAALLEVSLKTVKRRWRSARLSLHDKLGGELPGMG